MCGIAGVLDRRGAPADKLAPMLRAIVHRGPDDQGDLVDGPLAMGMRRLSIIDLAGGHQPIASEDGSVVVVFNGEIYNYLELRKALIHRGHQFSTNTDTEVLVHLYEDEGIDFLPRLNGMFGFALWDRDNRRLFVVRDRVGKKPMYYAETPHGVCFGTELKSLLASGIVPRTIDEGAIFDYLVHYYIPGEKTPFRGIKKLLPGHLLVADAEKGVSVRRWWDLADYTDPRDISRAAARDQIRELFFDAVRLRMRSDVPVGAYLSGGLDSSLVTVVAARQTDLPFSTFSVRFAKTEFDEMPYAREVARAARTQHHEIQVTPKDALSVLPRLVWHMDEPNGDSAILPTYLVSELAAKHVKVALSGIGADELFGGYPRYHRDLGKLERLAILPRPILRAMRPLLGAVRYSWGERLDRLISPPLPWRGFLDATHRFDEPTLRRLLHDEVTECGAAARRLFERYPGADYVNQRMFVDAQTYLPDQILSLTDRMSMARSLEARAPFLDYRLIELVTGLPGAWKVRGADWKILLKEAMGDLVPSSILQRPKWGFASPVEGWMTGEHLGALLRLCVDSRLSRAGLIDAAPMRELVSNPRALAYHAQWVWAVAVLEIWFRIYGEGHVEAAPAETLMDLAGG